MRHSAAESPPICGKAQARTGQDRARDAQRIGFARCSGRDFEVREACLCGAFQAGADAGVGQCRRWPMQMGPASLPTPLSPARGHPLLMMHPANLPHPLRQGMLGARCLASCCPVLRLALPEICHRRSRRHPAFAPALLRPFEARSLRCSLPCAVAWPRPRSFTDPGLRRFRTCVLPHHPIRPGSRPVRRHCVAPVSNEPACIWPKPLACPLSTGAWTVATAILGIKTPVTSRPCGFPFRLLRVPKTS